MEREHGGNAAPHAVQRAAECRGRNDADVAVRDVGRLVGDRVADGANAGSCDEKAESRRARRIDAPHANAVTHRLAGRGRDGDDVVSGVDETFRQILKVKLDAADPRAIPVADQRDFHVTRRPLTWRRARTPRAHARLVHRSVRPSSTRGAGTSWRLPPVARSYA